MDHKGVLMNTSIILDGVSGYGVERMLSAFKEDYNMFKQMSKFST